MQRNRSSRTATRSGLTLLDTMLVVLIVGLIAAVAAPRAASALDAVRSRAAAQRIGADLQYFRRVAITRSQDVVVTFTTDPPGYTTDDVSPPGGRTGQPWTVELDPLSNACTVAADFNGGATLCFDYRGTPSAAGPELTTATVTVTFGRTSRSLTVDPVSGRVLLAGG